MLVVDDPPMSAAIERLRAEWRARTGGTLVIAQATTDELMASNVPPAADAVIYPSRLIGTLAERGTIGPLPADYASNRELAWSDTFELLQVAETRWSGVPYAVPFGSPVLTCYYRPDLLERVHKQPPQTWEQYHELAELLAERKNLGDAAPANDAAWHGSVQPLAEGWASSVLLARAAAYAKHRDHYSTLFNIDSMQPLIAGPAFVRALEELIDDYKLGPAEQLEMDVEAAKREFLAGRAALVVAWPGHAVTGGRTDAPPLPTGFAELPGATEMHNFARAAWEDRHSDDSPHVPLLGLAGRLGSIMRQTAQPERALQLLAWLSGREWGSKVSGASSATTLYRRSQLRAPSPWLDPGTDSAAAQQYATSTFDALVRQQYLQAPRMPGESRYMAALDGAVRRALAGKQSADEALAAAAGKWQQITTELGLEAQRKAYRASLGLEP